MWITGRIHVHLYSRIGKETYSNLSSREIIVRSPKELWPLRIICVKFSVALRECCNDNNNNITLSSNIFNFFATIINGNNLSNFLKMSLREWNADKILKAFIVIWIIFKYRFSWCVKLLYNLQCSHTSLLILFASFHMLHITFIWWLCNLFLKVQMYNTSGHDDQSLCHKFLWSNGKMPSLTSFLNNSSTVFSGGFEV